MYQYHQLIGSLSLLFQEADDCPNVIATDSLITVITVGVMTTRAVVVGARPIAIRSIVVVVVDAIANYLVVAAADLVVIVVIVVISAQMMKMTTGFRPLRRSQEGQQVMHRVKASADRRIN